MPPACDADHGILNGRSCLWQRRKPADQAGNGGDPGKGSVIAKMLTVIQTVRASPQSDCVKPFTAAINHTASRWRFTVLWRTYWLSHRGVDPGNQVSQTVRPHPGDRDHATGRVEYTLQGSQEDGGAERRQGYGRRLRQRGWIAHPPPFTSGQCGPSHRRALI